MKFIHAWMRLENGDRIACTSWAPGGYIRKIVDEQENERIFRRIGDTFTEIESITFQEMSQDWTVL